ncbi:dnaJ homolog subfamily C member 4-like [Homarus americanus]|uniref:dnaJ homolog subfamily C member 4-like n=1 Tax=Homarus americanus TaxID=6706 RepID=UPI001C491043|nr:dnaJ homolog subfamily C member 4-like [Homarus americanus]
MQSNTLKRMTFHKRLIMSSFTSLTYQATRPLSTASLKTQNHYEVLGLGRDCTPADIKESFLRLSMELHPDKNPDSPKHHQQFVAMNEAYSVLSKPHSRLAYDADLAFQERPNMHTYGDIRTDAPRERVIFRDETLWENRDRSEDHKYEGRPYYGIRGIDKKLPNSYIAAGAILFMVVGAIFHFFIAKKSSDFAIEHLNRRDRIAGEHHRFAKEQARLNGNELQMLLFRQKSEEETRRK